MKLPDTTLLVYCVNARSPHRAAATGWLKQAFAEPEGIGLAWNALIGFVRVATHPRFLSAPIALPEALGIVDDWMAHPQATVLHPTSRHADLLGKFLLQVGTGGNLTNDAHLAALAVEHGATVGTFDRDFTKFKGVRIDLLA